MRVELEVAVAVAVDKIISFMLSATSSATLAVSAVSNVSPLPSTTVDSAVATSTTFTTVAGAETSSYGCANSFSIFLKRSSNC